MAVFRTDYDRMSDEDRLADIEAAAMWDEIDAECDRLRHLYQAGVMSLHQPAFYLMANCHCAPNNNAWDMIARLDAEQQAYENGTMLS